jgi:peptidoglycan/LPS O-acetylase OafA/YrhL
MVLLGIASYPIYLLHMPISRFLDVLAGATLARFAPFSGIFVVGFVFVAAVVVAQKLDTPIRRYLTTRVRSERFSLVRISPGSGAAG